MNPKRRNGSRVIAVLLLFAIAQIGLQVGFAEPNTTTNPTAIPQQFVARLTTRNNQPITVNLGPLGQLDIAPNTKLVLTYDENGNVKALLIYGCAILTAKKKTKGEVATEQGSAGKTDPAAGGILDICFLPGA